MHTYGPELLEDEGPCTPTRTRKDRSKKILSDTGGEASGAGKKPCRCGSLAHSRTSHRDCPLNKRRVGAASSFTPVITTADSDDEDDLSGAELIEYDFSDSEEGGYCSDELGSGDDSSGTSDEAECTCGGERTHSRSCPLNPRNVGSRTGGVSTSVPRAQSPSSDCLDSEGEGIVHCESPKAFAITGTPPPNWRVDAVAFLGTLTDAPLVKECEDVRPIVCREIAPHIRDSIRPDGNCLYRAISKQVTGSQENHVALRLAVIQLMKSML